MLKNSVVLAGALWLVGSVSSAADMQSLCQIFDQINFAAANNRVDILEGLAIDESLVNCIASNGHTPIQNAVIFGHSEAANWLLDHGANPRVLSMISRESLLHFAINAASPYINSLRGFLLREEQHLALFEKLCALLWNDFINHQDILGNTPLHYAYFYSNDDCINLLLHYGANPYVANKNGRFPFQINSTSAWVPFFMALQ